MSLGKGALLHSAMHPAGGHFPHRVADCAGRPIAWFGRPLLAYAMYLPAAVAGALLPYAAITKPSQQAAITHGAAIAHAALAALMSAAGLRSGFALALWALTGVLCLLCPRQASSASAFSAPQCKQHSMAWCFFKDRERIKAHCKVHAVDIPGLQAWFMPANLTCQDISRRPMQG